LVPPSISLCPCFKPAFLQRDWRFHQGNQHTPGHSSPNAQVWFHYQAQSVVNQACRVAPSRKVQSVAIQSLLRFGGFSSTSAFRSQVVLSWCSGPAVQLSVAASQASGGPSCDGRKCCMLRARRSFAVCSCGSACSCWHPRYGLVWFVVYALFPLWHCTQSAHGTVTQPRQPLVLLLSSSSIIVCFLHRRTRPLRVACFAVFRVCHGHPRPLRASARVLSS
jgi:hypothetical protein